MSKLEFRPGFLLRVLAVLGLLINLGIVVTGVSAKDDTGPAVAANPRVQQRTLETLDSEIKALLENQFPTITEAQEKAFKLFSLAQDHDVEIRSLVNSDPQSEKLGRTNFQTLVSRVEIRGQRSNIIGMLLRLRDIFGDTMLISNVSVNGTPEDWVIQFVLTQYLRPT